MRRDDGEHWCLLLGTCGPAPQQHSGRLPASNPSPRQKSPHGTQEVDADGSGAESHAMTAWSSAAAVAVCWHTATLAQVMHDGLIGHEEVAG